MNKYHCRVCDKTLSKSIKRNHEKLKSHKRLSLSVVNRFFYENVKVKYKDQILQDHT